MGKIKSIRDNITMVLGNLAKYLREWGLKSKLCRTSRWDNDPERLVVKQMLLGLRTARCRDAVWQELQFSYDDADCPTLLIEVMVLQLDKFEAAKEVLGVMVTDSAKARAKAGSSGKGDSAKAKSENSLSEDSGTSWGSCYHISVGNPTTITPDTQTGVSRTVPAGRMSRSSSANLARRGGARVPRGAQNRRRHDQLPRIMLLRKDWRPEPVRRCKGSLVYRIVWCM